MDSLQRRNQLLYELEQLRQRTQLQALSEHAQRQQAMQQQINAQSQAPGLRWVQVAGFATINGEAVTAEPKPHLTDAQKVLDIEYEKRGIKVVE